MKRNGQVTIKDIARQLELSPKAVSMGLNGTGRLAAATRTKIRETARAMNYKPNVAARSLVMQKSYLIGVVVPYKNGSFFSSIIAGIENIAHKYDFSVLLGNSDGEEQERHSFERLLQRNVDGIIFYPRASHLPLYREFCRELPAVQIMNYLPELNEHYVVVDNRGGGRLAIRHLLELKHREIGLITHDDESAELRFRKEGALQELAANGIRLPEKNRENCYMSIATGEEAALRLLRRAPEISAIFALSDFAGLGTVRAALQLGRRIPEDLAVIGFDDLEIAARQMVYPLSTVVQPKEQIGRLAIKMLLDLIAGRPIAGQQLELPLAIRRTTLKQP